MAGSIGTQHRLGGKDTFNPLCAMSFPFAPLSVSPAQHLLASPGVSLQLMSSQMFGLKRVLRLTLPFDLVVLALGALGAQLGATGSSPPDLLPVAMPQSLHPCHILPAATSTGQDLGRKNPVSCSPSILCVSAEVEDSWWGKTRVPTYCQALGLGREAEHSRDRGGGDMFLSPWPLADVSSAEEGGLVHQEPILRALRRDGRDPR